MAKSPIETALHRALRRVGVDLGAVVYDYAARSGKLEMRVCDGTATLVPASGRFEWPELETLGDIEVSNLTMVIASDVLAAGYRLDLVVMCRERGTFCGSESPVDVYVPVECDGHEFHEKMPQQAARDKARDRELARKLGVPVIRFAGTEIARDSDGCAREIIDTCLGLHRHRTLAHSTAAKRALDEAEWLARKD